LLFPIARQNVTLTHDTPSSKYSSDTCAALAHVPDGEATVALVADQGIADNEEFPVTAAGDLDE
jgi:hypothetical protein